MRASPIGLFAASLVTILVGRAAKAAPPDAPVSFLDVKEWWGSYSITVTSDQSDGGKDDGLAWTATERVRRRCEGEFHLDRTTLGGFGLPPAQNPQDVENERRLEQLEQQVERLRRQAGMNNAPGKDAQNAKPPPNADRAAVKQKQPRRWYYTRRPPLAFVSIEDSWTTTHELPVEGKFIDNVGETVRRAAVAKKKPLPDVRLVIDPEKSTYGIILPYRPAGNDGSKRELTYRWMRMWNGKFTDSTETKTTPWRETWVAAPSRFTDDVDGLIGNQELPGNGVSVLKGSVTYDMPTPLRETSARGGAKGVKKPAKVTFSWFISPKPPEQVELVLEPAEQKAYDDWRPMASVAEDTEGSNIRFRARLQKTGGGAPEKEKLVRLTFRLEDVSQQPGVCINYPQKLRTADAADLKFLQTYNPGLGVPDDGKSARKSGKFVEAEVEVCSFDFGAFGTISATGELESGRELTAYVKGELGRTTLRIPRSREDSHIADAWRKDREAQGADSSDEDDAPAGDRNKGDGISLYEEYRGIMMERAQSSNPAKSFVHWTDLDPKKKDFFIIDRVGGEVKTAIRKFEQLSGLAVHHNLSDNTTRGRVVNFNHDWAHRVDQHAIAIVPSPRPGVTHAVGGPSTPKNISSLWVAGYIGVGVGDGDDPIFQQSSATRPIVRALFMCCNVWPHGDDDEGEQTWVAFPEKEGRMLWRMNGVDDGGRRIIPGPGDSQINLFRESAPNVPFDPGFNSARVFVGNPGGRLSGDEDCIMREQLPAVYKKGPGQYYWTLFDEKYGWGLCTSRDGHDTNKPDRKTPRSRYFSALANRGNCCGQILVNDGVAAPRR